ncbi:MAG: Fe-S cluster assembly protein IscX [Gammaproteobacteria bacterium]
MGWTDIFNIAVELAEQYPDIDPQWISFPDLHAKVVNLNGFHDDPKKSNEKILEAIQMAWIEETE